MSDTIDKLDGANVRFACSATRHRVSRDRIRHVIANYNLRFEQSPQDGPGTRSNRIVYLGDDPKGQAVEVMAVKLDDGDLFVIHAMPMRKKYMTKYKEATK